MKAALLKVHPIMWVLLIIGSILLAIAIPGISRELEQDRAREIRVCEMSKVMSGEDPTVAELLCAEGWRR